MLRLRWMIFFVVVVLAVSAGCSSKTTTTSSRQSVTPKLKVSISDLKPLIPPGYTIKKWLTADLDGDKKEELVFVAEALKTNEFAADNPPIKLIVFVKKAKGWQELWYCDSAGYLVGRGDERPREPALEVGDINNDGLVELVFTSSSSCGATDMVITTYVYSCRQGRFVDLFGNRLEHMLDGGVLLAPRNVCHYQSNWDEGECHADPHRYKVKIYQWDGKKYALKKEFLTGAKGKKGEEEAKKNFQAFVAGKPIVIAKQPKPKVEERLDPSLYRDAIDEPIKANLKKMWLKSKSPGYILDSCDTQCFQDGEEDVRVRDVLKALTQQYHHRLAVRVKSGYDWIDAPCRESMPGWQCISRHSRGLAMAFDIFFADGVEIGWQGISNTVKQQKAKDKVRELLKEILAIGRQNNYYLPTQLCVYHRDDIMAFTNDARELYGGYPPDTGLRGMQAGDRYWDRIHVGY